ncbi:MAG: UDP-3-O-(3-hydroxymyristoyl)glucosamine N-acyltransferase [Phycisphaeraceae bacterium]|nr:UDP-3-O-(3-hydroxymyristoyl)glucosamine N-acyltransferase [Phycisphaeraceae bacterium]
MAAGCPKATAALIMLASAARLSVMAKYTIQQISDHVNGQVNGSGQIQIDGVEQITLAQPGQITFVGDPRHAHDWACSKASAAIVSSSIKLAPGSNRALVVVPDADLAIAKLLSLFAPPAVEQADGIHPQTAIHPSAQIGDRVSIGSGCHVGPRVIIENGARLYPNVTIFDDSKVGSDSILWSGVVIREGCTLGRRCIIHSNATIGSDGFGFRASADGKEIVKIPQIGTVQIGRDVEIGAGTCIDRAKFSATTVGDHTKIDNLCQIGHNCQIGRRCIIVGMTGIAGSVTIEDDVIIAGRVSIRDHITIGAGAQLGGGTIITRNVEPGIRMGGHFPTSPVTAALRQMATIRKLPELAKLLREG